MLFENDSKHLYKLSTDIFLFHEDLRGWLGKECSKGSVCYASTGTCVQTTTLTWKAKVYGAHIKITMGIIDQPDPWSSLAVRLAESVSSN